jgi:hypothetical protein
MIRVRKSHIALPRQPTALEICAIVFSRRRGGITGGEIMVAEGANAKFKLPTFCKNQVHRLIDMYVHIKERLA